MSVKSDDFKSKYTIWGIDPGLHSLGFAVVGLSQPPVVEYSIEKLGRKKRLIPQMDPVFLAIESYMIGILKIKANRSLAQKVYFIFDQLCNLFAEYTPDLVIVEDAFVGINKNSGLKLGVARGAILTAIGKYEANFEIMAPSEIKMEIVGNGGAEKDLLRSIIFEKLAIVDQTLSLDASDALAAAVCGVKYLSKMIQNGKYDHKNAPSI